MRARLVLFSEVGLKRHLPSSTEIMARMFICARLIAICLLTVGLAWPTPVCAYAVLSHEAIIDAAWETHIKPLLLKRFPQASEEDLSRAQAYAYGGAIIQDMGYYPYGNPFFSDLRSE